MTTLDRDACAALDRDDALGALRELFTIPDGLIYLDGNSLGPLPAATAARVHDTVVREWGSDLITSWNANDWIDLPQRIGDKIARLIGAGRGEVIVADSTSIDMFKALSAAVDVVRSRPGGAGRTEIVSERLNFPTDLYIAHAVAETHGMTLRLIDRGELPAVLGPRTAIAMITHVDYRTGEMHDMRAVTEAVHDAGAVMVWDLCHSVGAVPVDLRGAGADFAVGCGYKYLNGGPGAPAFVWVAPQHVGHPQPLRGWLGHRAPFEFTPEYAGAPGIGAYQCGTPPILSLVALECGVDTLLAADPFGGMSALRAKSLALTSAFIELATPVISGHGGRVVTPRDESVRGSQVSIAFPGESAYGIVQALIGRRVIGDFRTPDIARFGFAPMYTRFVDVYDAVEQIAAVLETGEFRDARFAVRAAVT